MALNLVVIRADTDRGTAPISTLSPGVRPAGFSGTLRAFDMKRARANKKGLIQKKKEPLAFRTTMQITFVALCVVRWFCCT